ncbi:hypothetical protein TR66_17565 [Streptomyces sp. WM6391]|nr:hypothetical protein TR66_17565 [Streptomyces sp. WM6391]
MPVVDDVGRDAVESPEQLLGVLGHVLRRAVVLCRQHLSGQAGQMVTLRVSELESRRQRGQYLR